jgi:hypothetical protein
VAAGHLIAALALALALLPGSGLAQGLKGPPPAEETAPPRKQAPAEDLPPRREEPRQAEPQRPRRLDLQVVRIAGSGPVLVVQGPFGAGDAERFEAILNANPGIREVLFNSPGGSVEEGLDIGRLIRARKLATRVPSGAECDSICTMAFLGGVLRRIDTGAKYCVHMFAASDPELFNRLTGIIKENGPDATREVIEVMQATAARIAASWARYLIEMQVSLRLMTPTFRTRNRDVYCLERDELRDYVVINVN